MNATSIADWNTYLATQASVAATLTGLVFVSVSINLSRIISIPGLTGRAAESLMQLFGVVIISTTGLIPRQTLVAMGAQVLLAAALLWGVQTAQQIRYVRIRTGHPRSWIFARMTQTQLATLPFCVSAILLLRESPMGFYWLVPGCMFSMISGVVSAWVLLVEILR